MSSGNSHDERSAATMTEIPAALATAFRDLVGAVEEHLSAYTESDEMAESDQALADALARVEAARR